MCGSRLKRSGAAHNCPGRVKKRDLGAMSSATHKFTPPRLLNIHSCTRSFCPVFQTTVPASLSLFIALLENPALFVITALICNKNRDSVLYVL